MLLSCETSKERKCQREGLDILLHYHHREQATTANVDSVVPDAKEDGDVTACRKSDEAAGAGECGTKGLSLEEEIAMLNSGVSTDDILQCVDNDGVVNAAKGRKKGGKMFQVYDTSVGGTVFVLCTLPGCSIDTKLGEGQEVADDASGDKETADPPPSDGMDEKVEENKKRKTADGTAADDISTSATTKKQKVQPDQQPTTHSTDQQNPIDNDLPPTWDPVQTVQSIIHDIKTENPHTTITPSSRFVTRMIPIQHTCYASLVEMRHHLRALLIAKFIPIGVERYRNRTVGGDAEYALPSFKIDFRRRNCSNAKRADVIDMIAGVVAELTEKALAEEQSGGEDSPEVKGSSGDKVVVVEEKATLPKKQLFKVDLKDPEYTILIEICQTICGMSVLPNARAFHNFNLIALREKAKSEEITTDT